MRQRAPSNVLDEDGSSDRLGYFATRMKKPPPVLGVLLMDFNAFQHERRSHSRLQSPILASSICQRRSIGDPPHNIKSFATDDDQKSVCAFGVFSGTHSGQGGPRPPTGKSTNTDYVYVMEFEGDKIHHMTKIWNAGWAMRELGW